MKHLLITIIAVFLESLVISDTIHNYAKDGDIVGLREQLDLGKDVSSEDELGWTPLHYAAFENHKASAIFLINRGANLNAKAMENGFSPSDHSVISFQISLMSSNLFFVFPS